jgi:hypothetical protein
MPPHTLQYLPALSDSERLGENDLYGVSCASAVFKTPEREGLRF